MQEENLVRRLKMPNDILHYHGCTPEDIRSALKLYDNDVPRACYYLTHELKPNIIESLGGEKGIRGSSFREVKK